jgi:hypothetical protein
MKKTTANWLASAHYDLQTAEAMLAAKRYVYGVFMCHRALEKRLKGLWAEAKNDTPPAVPPRAGIGRRVSAAGSQPEDGPLTHTLSPQQCGERDLIAR